jgi:hypothetical protein
VLANGTKGLSVESASNVVLENIVSSETGLGNLWADTVVDSHNVTLTACNFTSSLGHGLSIFNSTSVTATDVTITRSAVDGLRVVDCDDVSLVGLRVSSSHKAAMRAINTTNLELSAATITENAAVDSAGVWLDGVNGGTISKSAVTGNGANFVVASSTHLAFENVECSVALYTAWAVSCDHCTDINVSCATTAVVPRQSRLLRHCARYTQGLVSITAPAAIATSPSAAMAAACVIAPGEPIQPAIDAMAHSGGGVCTLTAGVHLVHAPILLRANVRVQGEGASCTTLRSEMLRPDAIKRLCAFGGGNCAVLTVDNSSRQNISIHDLAIDGGIDAAFVANSQDRCGLHDAFVSAPCPPCRDGNPTNTFTQCGWNNLGILITDYNMPRGKGSPQNISLSGLHVYGCAMGVHVLGTVGISITDSVFENNGNGCAFYHNAYFLRVIRAVFTRVTFRGSTGHGLKITTQNDTIIDNCTVTDNQWQGIWVGGEMHSTNYRLQIINTVIQRNGMNGIQLEATDGFAIRNCVIRNQPTAGKAGLTIESSSNGVVEDSTLSDNAVNLVVGGGVHNLSLRNIDGCSAAFVQGYCGPSGAHSGPVINCSCAAAPSTACQAQPIV